MNAHDVGSDGLRIAILTGTGEKAFCARGRSWGDSRGRHDTGLQRRGLVRAL